VPLAILLAGGLATVGVWRALDTARRHQVSREVEAETAAVAHELAARIDDRTRALARVVGRWSRSGRPAEIKWRDDVQHDIDDLPGFQAIAWVDRSLAVAWVEPNAGNEGVVGVDLGREPVQRATMDEARARRAARATPPLALRKAASGRGSSFRSSSERTSRLPARGLRSPPLRAPFGPRSHRASL
jgi:sensor domain CHASE-containing protein